VSADPVADAIDEVADEVADEAEARLRLIADETDQVQSEDFDAFWSVQEAKEPDRPTLANVLGSGFTLRAPAEIPLYFEILRRKLAHSVRAEDVRTLFDLLFTSGTYDKLAERGLQPAQLALLVSWGGANAGDRRASLAQVKAGLDEIEADAAGKANAPGGRSSKAGGSSRPTSRASTSSKKPASQR